jgi:simple sugar transport system ATP-binding protein
MSEFAVQMMNISKYFGSQAANDHVEFSLRSGTIHGLLGENGAGKTTLMNILFGLQKADEGKILVHGEELSLAHSPNDSMKGGIGMVHQHFKLVKTMTVTENFLLGLRISRYPLLNPKVVKKRILQLSGEFSLNIDPDAKIGNLSVGEQQRVEILSALYRDASVLILDEPTAVLTPEEAQEFFVILKALRKGGKSIILISHHLDEIVQIADEVTVLKNGRVAGTATIDASIQKEDLSRMMVGRDVLFDFDTRRKACGEEKLIVQNICAKNERSLEALKNLSFSVRRGEIFAIAGVDGNGQKELCEVLVGLRKPTGGTVLLDNTDLTGKSPAYIIANHVSYIPEDRQSAGLVLSWSIKENLVLKTFKDKAVSGSLFLKKKKIDAVAQQLSKDYAIKSQGIDSLVKNLSGGNQQKVILARELSEEPALLVASHPTRGLDVGAMEYVRQQMLNVRNAGGAVLLVSADLEEIFQIADRILVLYGGKSMGIVKPQEGIEVVGQMMAGICNKELQA